MTKREPSPESIEFIKRILPPPYNERDAALLLDDYVMERVTSALALTEYEKIDG